MISRTPSLASAFGPPLVLVAALLGGTALGGCAPLAPNLAYQGFGPADPRRDRNVADAIVQMEDAPPPEKVAVLLDTIPDGIRVDGAVARVEPGWTHKVLGRVTISPNGHVALMALLGFPDYESAGHKAACYPQTILTYATLTLWSIVSPTAYPCWGRAGLDEDVVVDSLRKAGATAGGDLVIASLVRVTGQSRVFGATGIVLRADPRLRGGAPATADERAPGTTL